MERNWRLEAQMVAACKSPPTTPGREEGQFHMEHPLGVHALSPLSPHPLLNGQLLGLGFSLPQSPNPQPVVAGTHHCTHLLFRRRGRWHQTYSLHTHLPLTHLKRHLNPNPCPWGTGYA